MNILFEGESISENIIEHLENAGEIGEELSDGINWLSSLIIEFKENAVRFGVRFVLAILIFIIGGRVISIIRKIVKKSLTRAGIEEGVKQFLDSTIKVILYLLLVALIASFFGVQTTSMVALLGSAGVAIALALQGSLSNVTGGILLLILAPFKVGDYIVEDNHGNEGTVIEIQLFYTKLRTVDDKIVILPNGSLANTSITNFTLSPDRRVCLKVGIAYDSDIKKAKEVIRKCIDELDCVLTDKPIEIYVDELADSAVVIGYRFFVNNENYWTSRWELNENVKISLDKAGVEIPFNQIDVHMK